MKSITSIDLWSKLRDPEGPPQHPLVRFADDNGIIELDMLQLLMDERFSAFKEQAYLPSIMQELQNQLSGLMFEILACDYKAMHSSGQQIHAIKPVLGPDGLAFQYLDADSQPLGDLD